jgi:hypothetical protein
LTGCLAVSRLLQPEVDVTDVAKLTLNRNWASFSKISADAAYVSWVSRASTRHGVRRLPPIAGD